MQKHDFVEITKGLYKGLQGYIDSFPTPRQAYLITHGGLCPLVRLSSLRLVPDEERTDLDLDTNNLPF